MNEEVNFGMAENFKFLNSMVRHSLFRSHFTWP